MLKDMLGAFPLPYFLMMGNHDDRDVFLRIFDNYHQDPMGFIQFKYQCSAGTFIFLDTSKEGADEHEGQLCDARLEWLKEQLIAAEDEPVFIFMHHPPFEIGQPANPRNRITKPSNALRPLKTLRDKTNDQTSEKPKSKPVMQTPF